MIKNVFGTTVDLLGEAIVSGRYPVGDSLPAEPLLCEELGVSRSVLREAVKSLVAKGLLTSARRGQPGWHVLDNIALRGMR